MNILYFKKWRDFRLCQLYNLHDGYHVMRVNPIFNQFLIVQNFVPGGLFPMEVLLCPLPKPASGVATLESHDMRLNFLQTLYNMSQNEDIRKTIRLVWNHIHNER